MPRRVIVSTVSFGSVGGPTLADNLAKAHRLLEVACAMQPDIVCLPETFASMHVAGRAAELALPVPGPAGEMAGEFARRHRTYIICPFLERAEGRVYNTAFLFDRQGEIVGAYRKVHPVTSTADYTELEDGVTPGTSPIVLQTDFGRIGILICFDIGFAESWAALKAGGAEIVFWPSAYNGGFPLQVYAGLHHYYVVSAVQSDRPRFVDINGQIILQGDRRSPVLTATLDLEKGLYHTDFNASQIELILRKYGRDVTVRVSNDDGMFTLASCRDDLTVPQLEAEFGLERLEMYLARNRAVYDALAAGQRPTPQATAYLGHPQWI